MGRAGVEIGGSDVVDCSLVHRPLYPNSPFKFGGFV